MARPIIARIDPLQRKITRRLVGRKPMIWRVFLGGVSVGSIAHRTVEIGFNKDSWHLMLFETSHRNQLYQILAVDLTLDSDPEMDMMSVTLERGVAMALEAGFFRTDKALRTDDEAFAMLKSGWDQGVLNYLAEYFVYRFVPHGRSMFQHMCAYRGDGINPSCGVGYMIQPIYQPDFETLGIKQLCNLKPDLEFLLEPKYETTNAILYEIQMLHDSDSKVGTYNTRATEVIRTFYTLTQRFNLTMPRALELLM